MTLTQLVPPYPIFTDRDGSPLDAGYLYFGEPNLNPETNPIQVYYDPGLTQPLAQPIRTSNGYVMRNGSPALIYADGQFSVTVRNKKNELVIYSPVGFGITPSVPFAVFENSARDVSALLSGTQFTYLADIPNTIQVVAGEILRTLSEGFAYEVALSSATDHHVTTAGGVKLYVQAGDAGYNVKAFGAEGDGISNDTIALQSAIGATPNNGRVYIPAGNYIITSTLSVNAKRIVISGDGSFSSQITNNGTGDAIKFDGAYWQKVFGMRITGNATSGHGINFSTLGSYSQVVECYVDGHGGHGIYIQPDQYGLIIERCYTNENALDGINAVAGANLATQQVNAIYITETESKNNDGNGITASGVNFNIVNCILEGNGAVGGASTTGHGIMVTTVNASCFGLGVSGCYIENNKRSGIKFLCFATKNIFSASIDNNYFNSGPAMAEGAHVVAVTDTAGAGLVNMQIGPSNYFYSDSGDKAVDLGNAVNSGDGQSRVYANVGQFGSNSETWTAFFQNIGSAAIVPYVKTKTLSGLLSSSGTIIYSDVNVSNNMTGGVWPKQNYFDLGLSAGALLVKAGVTVYTDSINWSITFTIVKVQKDVFSSSTVVSHTISSPVSGVFQSTPNLSTLVGVDNLRVLPTQALYLIVSVTDSGAGPSFRVANPVLSYLE